MSTSPKSEPESESSPATGDESEPAAAVAVRARPVEVELEVSRQRTATRTVFGLVVGVLCVWKLGTVGVWAGFALIAYGAWRGFRLAQTFMNPPGTFTVKDAAITLPRGLCVGKPLQVTAKDVTAAYILRRSVPWQMAAPVLVVELGPKALAYPRDWFATEADQRELANSLSALTKRTDT